MRGKGLFALENLPSEFYITYFKGVEITKEECERHPDLSYVFEIKGGYKTRYIDTYHTESLARYFNDSVTSEDANVIVRTCNVEGEKVPYFETCRPISKGEELTYWYGRDDKTNPQYAWRHENIKLERCRKGMIRNSPKSIHLEIGTPRTNTPKA